jgi:hypothetical protein
MPMCCVAEPQQQGLPALPHDGVVFLGTTHAPSKLDGRAALLMRMVVGDRLCVELFSVLHLLGWW